MSGSPAPRLFLEAAQNRKVLGAYLLVCSRLSVADRLADSFLSRLFCKKGGCGACLSCAKVKEGHVDILRLRAPKVDELREALKFVAEKPYEGDRKAVVVSAADDMTPQAANSLLKTLEEPPPGTVFVLTARAVCGVLPTVASRCAIVPVTPPPNARAAIMEALGCDAQTAAILKDLSGGFPGEAARIHADTAFLGRREETLCLLHRLLMQKGKAISTFADYLETCKENIADLLCVMLGYLRDIRVYQKTRNEALVINRDRRSDIADAACVFTSGAIRNMIDVILETQRRFSVPVNFRLAAERMLFCILEEKDRW